LAQAAADTLTWLAGIELLISEKQQEYAQRMLQLQLEAAVPAEQRNTERIAALRASARESLDEVRELLGLLRSTLDQLPTHLHEAPESIAVASAVPDPTVARPVGAHACPSMAEVAAASAFVERLPSVPFRGNRAGIATDCPICLHTLFESHPTRTHEVVALPCGNGTHCFHRHCIHEWVRLSACCPLCRKGLWSTSPPPSPKDEADKVGLAVANEEVPSQEEVAEHENQMLVGTAPPLAGLEGSRSALLGDSNVVHHIHETEQESFGVLSQPPTGWTAWGVSPAAARGAAGAEDSLQLPSEAWAHPARSSTAGDNTGDSFSASGRVAPFAQAMKEGMSSSSFRAETPDSAARPRLPSQVKAGAVRVIRRREGGHQARSMIRSASASDSAPPGLLQEPPASAIKAPHPRGFMAQKLRSTSSSSVGARTVSNDLAIAGQEIRPSSAANRTRKQHPWQARLDSQEQLRPGTAAAALSITANSGTRSAGTAAWFPFAGNDVAAGACSADPLNESLLRHKAPVVRRPQQQQFVMPSQQSRPNTPAGTANPGMRRQHSRPGSSGALMGSSMSAARRHLVPGLT